MKPAKKKKIKKKIEGKVLSIFLKERKKSFNYKQLASRMKETDSQVKLMIAESLVELTKQKKLKETEPGRFKLISTNAGIIEGSIDISRKGSVFFMSESLLEDVPVRKKSAKGFLKGDIVLAEISMHKGKESADIVQLVSREEKSYVGILDISDSFAFLKPDDPFMPVDIFVPLNKLKGAQNGQKVLVRIKEWPETADSPFGEVITVIGNPGETHVEMESILYEFGLPFDFPAEVLQAAQRIPIEVTEKDIEGRRDFREICTFTIDPHDAKDFDDALSFEWLSDDQFRVGVHIADVSHYVKEGSILDKEAVKRATSVYLANQVVPMLPEVLSNVVCSLRPNETKLCFAAVFDIDLKGKVHQSWIGRTVIHSDKRFTYGEAQKVIETGEGEMADELSALNTVARILREERMAFGGFDFSSEEIDFVYDKHGEPLKVKKKVISESNELIEDYMLLANKCVAEWVGKIKPTPPFIYRNHDSPDLEKLTSLKRFVNSLDMTIDVRSAHIRKELRGLLEQAEHSVHKGAIQQMVIRSMAKADYGMDNIGHYGLAFDNYSHFTSPIRRYPDVVAHRLLAKYLDGAREANKGQIEYAAKHSSVRERKAVEAERASKKFMQAFYLRKYIGKEFLGTISGVTKYGLFVIIQENFCEGMVSIRSMEGDRYAYDEAAYAIIGQRSNVTYRLGDEVMVSVLSADPLERKIDLTMVQED